MQPLCNHHNQTMELSNVLCGSYAAPVGSTASFHYVRRGFLLLLALISHSGQGLIAAKRSLLGPTDRWPAEMALLASDQNGVPGCWGFLACRPRCMISTGPRTVSLTLPGKASSAFVLNCLEWSSKFARGRIFHPVRSSNCAFAKPPLNPGIYRVQIL